MKFRCYAEGEDPSDEPDIHVADGTENPRAAAAAKFCATSADELDGREPVDVYVEAKDDAARALPGWESDENGQFVRFRVTPARTIVWAAEQVADFVDCKPVDGGERASEEA